MSQDRPSFQFALIDLPSDHEIEGELVTEPQMIRTILHNRGFGTSTTLFRATTKERFKRISQPDKTIRFVHLATHGEPNGILLFGSLVRWSDVAETLTKVAPSLSDDGERVLCLSCCCSSIGYSKMRTSLRGHFTGAFYFSQDTILFEYAMATWAMFYTKEEIGKPPEKITEKINGLFGRKIISYDEI